MGRTERLELRVDDELLQQVDDWMKDTGRADSRSDAFRQLVAIGLATTSGKSLRLSEGDKLNFMLLRDLLKHFKVKTETDLDLMAEAIYGGHLWAPVWEMPGLFHAHTDQESDVKFVVDVLDMWSFIESRLEQLPVADVLRVKDVNVGYLPEFSGFDGNNESELLGIAQFLIRKMNRFSRFGERDLNSHSPRAGRYRRMLATFLPMRATLGFGKDLTADQIIEIIEIRSA